MEFLCSNKDKKIDLSNIVSYQIERDFNDTFYFSAILDNEEIINILSIYNNVVTLECSLSQSNILDLLKIVEGKEHIFEITEIVPGEVTDLSLVVLNKLFISIYMSLKYNYKDLYNYMSSKYRKDENRILGIGEEKCHITKSFLPSELNGLFQSKQFLGFIKSEQLLFEKELNDNLPGIKCRLKFEDSGNTIRFCVIRKANDKVIEESLYGTYYKINNSYFPRLTLSNSDEVRTLMLYVWSSVCSPELIEVYKEIFKSIIVKSELRKDDRITSLYKELFGKDNIISSEEFDEDEFKFIKPSIKPFEKVKINNNSQLDKYAINLNKNKYSYDPSVGRSNELKDVMVSLVQGSSILVGEAGVGKTALVEGIAYQIQKGIVPNFLKNKEIYKITSSDIVSGCGVVGDIEKRMKDILEDVIKRGNVILFFDEIHTAFGTGKGKDGTLDIANILKPYVDRGQVKIIGATTSLEYDEHFDKDPAFKRRFEKVIIKEPDEDSLYQIIDNVLSYQEEEFNKYLNSNIDRDNFVKSLILLTKKNHRDQLNMEYNPALVLSILKKAFSYSVYYDNSDLELSDIEEAINKCTIISKPAKEEFERNKSTLVKEHEKVIKKVIDFSKK